MTVRRAAAPLDRPLLIWDGDCGFCRAAVERWRHASEERIDYATLQETATRLPTLDGADLEHAVHLLEPDGTLTRGAEAVFRALDLGGVKRWPRRLYEALPLFAWSADLVYRLAADNRALLSRLSRMWNGPTLQRPTYRVSSALFLRLLGLVYLFAFVSLGLQLDGLIGEHGILPVGEYLARIEAYNEGLEEPLRLPWRYPTLAWWNSSEGFLAGIAVAGAALSLLLVGGLLPMPILGALWILYLSLVIAGQTFLSFQWDILLVEAGFLAVWMAPATLRSRLRRARPPPRLALWLVWWLLFRLMLESGVVKLTWDNPYPAEALGPNGNTWEDLTALNYHYWTQPLWRPAGSPPSYRPGSRRGRLRRFSSSRSVCPFSSSGLVSFDGSPSAASCS